MKRKLIRVTKRHIRDGLDNNCRLCPVALAMREVFPTSAAIVDAEVVTLIHEGRTIKRLAPRSVTRFVYNFDAYKKVKPFNFYFKLS